MARRPSSSPARRSLLATAGRGGVATRSSIPEPAVGRVRRLGQPPRPGAAVAAARSAASQAPGTATTRSSCRQPGATQLSLQYHSQVPLSALRRRAGRRAARVARRHVPERRRAAARSGRPGDVRGADAGEHEVTVRAAEPAASRRRSAPRAASGSATSPRLARPRRHRAGDARATPAAATSTTSPTSARAGPDAALRHTRRGARRRSLGGETPSARAEVAKLVFVGGTGRSGTHVLSQLLSRHNRYGLVPVEVRFHTDPEGFPACSPARSTPEQFVRRLRGFWWRGFQTTPLPRHVPVRRPRPLRRRGRARSRPTTTTSRRPAGACSSTCSGSGSARAWEEEDNPRGEASSSRAPTRSPQRPTLARLFPEARFIHVVRDGRDASASRVAQTRGLVRPRTRVAGDRVVGGADRRDRARRRRDRPRAGC